MTTDCLLITFFGLLIVPQMQILHTAEWLIERFMLIYRCWYSDTVLGLLW